MSIPLLKVSIVWHLCSRRHQGVTIAIPFFSLSLSVQRGKKKKGEAEECRGYLIWESPSAAIRIRILKDSLDLSEAGSHYDMVGRNSRV